MLSKAHWNCYGCFWKAVGLDSSAWSELPWARQSHFPTFVWPCNPTDCTVLALDLLREIFIASDANAKDKYVVPHAPFLFFHVPRLYALPFFKERSLTDSSVARFHRKGMSSVKHWKPMFASGFLALQKSSDAKSRWRKECLLMRSWIKLILMLVMNYIY